MPSAKVSVVVVSFNTKEKLRRCLKCIEAAHQVIVVDNASTDGSAELVRTEFPAVRLIENATNVGFGPANNQGCAAACADLVLFLNSDAYAAPGAIEVLAGAFEDPSIVAAGGRLLNLDGSLQSSTANELTLWAVFCEQTFVERLFPQSPLLSPYWTTFRNANRTEPWETPQVMGACLMARAESGRPAELFDPRFFLYAEDTDFCLRLRKHGKIVYVPAAIFVHELGSSSAKDPAVGVIRYNRGKELYFQIHHGTPAAIACFALNRFGALLRFIVWTLFQMAHVGTSRRARALIDLFWRVLIAPSRFREASSRTRE